MPAAVRAAPVEGKLVRAATCDSLVLMVFSGFLCAFGKYVFGVFCKKKKSFVKSKFC